MNLLEVQTVAVIVSIIVGGIAILGFLFSVWRKVQTWSNTWELFMEDWRGSEERAGRDAVPGVMERLNRIDGELKHNSGSSMKDALKRIESKVDRIEERIEKGDKRFLEGEIRFNAVESRIERLESGDSNG